jgi:hypothetical protein
LLPLSDEEAALVLNRDRLIRREWRKWNAATGNRGSLIIFDRERVKTLLRAATEDPQGDDDVSGARVKVWLDDVREAPDGWALVKTPEQAIDLLRVLRH